MGEAVIKDVESGRTKVKEVAVGQECGLKIESRVGVEKNDLLVAFVTEEEKKND